MSYDVSFKAKLENCDTYVYVGGDYNYTSNMAKAIIKASGNNVSINDLNGMKTSEVLPILNKIIFEFVNNSKEYRQYEPVNGWGDIESCLEWLFKLKNECEKYPTAIVEVC